MLSLLDKSLITRVNSKHCLGPDEEERDSTLNELKELSRIHYQEPIGNL